LYFFHGARLPYNIDVRTPVRTFLVRSIFCIQHIMF
jgi:hypothetical protein